MRTELIYTLDPVEGLEKEGCCLGLLSHVGRLA